MNRVTDAMNGRFELAVVSGMLNLAPGACAEMVDVDPYTGDYRVFYLGMTAVAGGGAKLVFELHRQGPGFQRRIFNLLSLMFGPADVDGLCPVEAFVCDARMSMEDVPTLLPVLAQIVAALQEGKRPADALLLPFMSRSAQILWHQPLVKGFAA